MMIFRLPPSRRRGLTLTEICITLVVIAVLLSMAVVFYMKIIGKTRTSQAVSDLGAIRKAELSAQDEKGSFVNASDAGRLSEELGHVEVKNADYQYSVQNATAQNFTAVARLSVEDPSRLRPIEIAMYADGSVDYTYPAGTEPAASAGGYGGSSGSSGSGGGGSSGSGGSGGSLGTGGSGGSSGSGSSGGSSGSGSSGGSSGGGGGVFAFNGLPDAIANDGFVSLSWNVENVPDHYNIYRSLSADGGYVPLFEGWPGYVDFYSDLTVTNDATYYYRIDAVYSSRGTFSSSVILATPSTSSPYAVKAAAALALLMSSSSGLQIAQMISLYDVPVGFGVDGGALAWYEPYFNTIKLDLEQYEKTAEIQAALLAHEGTHAWWGNDYTQGMPDRVSPNSIDQEYHAFLNSASVWSEIKGTQTDPELDAVVEIMAQGEAVAKEVIRMAYAGMGLPEY